MLLGTADFERDRKELVVAEISQSNIRFGLACSSLRLIVALFWHGLEEVVGVVSSVRKIIRRK